ncbi:MAG: hypothetical protein AAB576_07195 [Elusimicrobiota bacterium]
MIKRDWFKRQIEILAQALGAALGLKGRGDIQGSIAEIETAIQKAFGMSGRLALGFSLEDFLSLACRGDRPTPELLSTLAGLFQEWGALLEAQGSAAEAAAARERAQDLLRLAEAERDG